MRSRRESGIFFDVVLSPRNTGRLLLLVVFVFVPLFTQQARAQFTANFQTNTISGVASNWVGTFYTVGSNTMSDALRVVNGGVLSNGSCVIGWAVGGSNNVAIVSDLGSAMSNRFELYLGNDGANNRLIVTNRGVVSSGHGYLGFNLFGTNNIALISDTGSVWRVKTNLFVGYVDGANQLVVSNGAVVSDQLGMIGSNANLNAAWVTGPGSTWSNKVSLVTGFIGSNNRLTVTNGGLVWSAQGIIGDANISHSNVVTVVGSGSTWRNTNALYVGFLGRSNTLAVANGGLVNANSGYVGLDVVSAGNTAIVTGSGSVWSNAINTYVGYAGVGNQLIVTNGGKAWDQAGTIGWTNSATGNSVLISDTGSVWSNTIFLYVGYVGDGNQLIVSNGAAVFSGTGYVGVDRFTSNNTATVTGNGSAWANTNFLYVGYIGSSNTLVIADGGRANGPETRIGYGPLTTNNVALITGSGALLSNTANTIVGYGGYAGQLIISNGATVYDSIGALGYTNQSSRNTATVTGSGSTWINTNNLFVGYVASSNTLVIADGGAVYDQEGRIGQFAVSSNNTVVVTGGGLWSHTANTLVGYGGPGNQLIITNGGMVTGGVGAIGYTNSSVLNVATVTGTGSTWENSGFVYVGFLSSSNALVIADGGVVNDIEADIGTKGTSSNNLAIVAGSGTLWSNSVNTIVGFAGDLNRLVVSNNAVVWDQVGIVGYTNSSAGNIAVVADGGVWSNTVNFQIGYKASFNQLIVTNGGRIYSPDSFIGTFDVGSSNAAIVTGSGSLWASTNNFYVGQDGRSNSLVIANGGGVSDANGFIGYNATADTNFVLVTGPGAAWTNTTLFYIGTFASGNALTISNGGTVYTSGDTILGYDAGGPRNSVFVTGGNSTWVNNRLYIGLSGASNTVTIANGGQGSGFDPYSSTIYLGYNPVSISNSVVVTGIGSYWFGANLYVGYASRSNSLTIANGGSLEDMQGYVGYNTGSNNFALVTGTGSKWQTDQYLYVGFGGSRNSLVISNGGVATCFNGGFIGSSGISGAVGVSNSVLVTDAGSAWINNGTTYIGYNCRGNSLIVSNGGRFGDLAAGLGYANSTGADGSNNFAFVTGSGSVWSNSGTLTIGDGAHSNRLTVALAGKLTGPSIFVGARGGINNLLRLTNGVVQSSSVSVGTGNFLSGSGTVTGSVLNNGTIAADINGATLTFTGLMRNNGALRANGGGIIEFYAPVLNFGTTNFTGGTAIFHAGIFSSGGSTNSWIFAGNGQWETSNRWSRAVPPSTDDSLVLITNATTKTVTVNSNTFNAAPNSVNNFSIAMSGPANVTNTLRIADTPVGTNFVALYFTIGPNAILSISNATVQAGELGVGDFTDGGELRVEPGGFLDASGAPTSTVGNATISGIFSNNVLYGVNGQLNVNDGGLLYNTGSALLDTNEVATVAGSNATWSTPSQIYVGYNGSGNRLTVTNHGALVTGQVSIGVGTAASNNVMTIAGDGSTWTNSVSLEIGGSVGNQLIASNGAKVANFGFITTVGGNFGGEGNGLIMVTGTNTSWTDFSQIWLGYVSGKNQFVVSDGASFSCGQVFLLGANFSASSNTVVATGSNTFMSASGFTVGSASPGNQVLVTNGATVAVIGLGTGTVGAGHAADSNVVTVAGGNSLWRMSALVVGNLGSNSNRVEITGGTVAAGKSAPLSGATIGVDGTNNVIHVNGGALVVTNSLGTAPLVVGQSGGPSTLLLDAGTVTVDRLIATNGLNSIITLDAGTMNSRAAFVTNAQPFVIGDGANTATYHLLGGTHSFATGLRVRNASFLTGCGTISGTMVVDAGGTVLADCGGVLTFTGSVTNNGTMRAINGSVLEAYGTVVNNGTIDLINGGSTNFHGAFINNGTVVDANSVHITQISTLGNDVNVQIPSLSGHTYQLQFTPSFTPTNWTSTGSSQAGNNATLTFTDSGGATNVPGLFYRIDVTAP